ncbi:MAG: protein-L-isoaspartate(D-aspartate) O-methyltransferase [Desulfobulbaceae bacterium]|nr:protein-L-isoaspartate(D-aspartate) O-methyltransferase [Desulfobulbaceae bacterium]
MILGLNKYDDISRLLRDIETEYHYTCGLTGKAALNERVREALRQVPRHAFVPSAMKPFAYDNNPLPIGHGQTISQPYIVALMSDLLETQEDHVVLEIGTGCGYQAAVLSRLVSKVYTIEIIPTLGNEANERLQRLGYTNIEMRIGDGYNGWEEHAPFDGIIGTAAASDLPPPLLQQLKPGGRMVIPVGLPHARQDLILLVKEEDGSITERDILPVAFVPFIRSH